MEPLDDDPADPDPLDRRGFERWLEAGLDEVYGEQRWIVATSIDQASTGLASMLAQRFGVEVLAVGARRGTGPIADSVPLISMGLPPVDGLMEGMRTAERALIDPPAEIRAQIDAWDPDGRALVLGEPFPTSATLLGRPLFGRRRPEWAALEDKLAIVEVLEAARVTTAASEQVPVTEADRLVDAHRRLATDLGTVWAGDNRSGWHGGGSGTFWIPDAASARVAAGDGGLAPFDRVRVMAFIAGIPCSIHGLVTDGERPPAVFRPCEMVMLRDPVDHRFVYARSATYWDPAEGDREQMRDVARRVGIELARRVDHRGVFTVDGVLGSGGFLPTEVNVRFGAALPSLLPTEAGGRINLGLVDRAVVEGVLDVDPDELERWVLSKLDHRREMRTLTRTGTAPPEPRRGWLVASGSDPDWGVALVDEEPPAALARVEWGPGPSGGVLRFDDVTGVPVGPPVGPRVVEWLRSVDRTWSIGLPPLEAARPAR